MIRAREALMSVDLSKLGNAVFEQLVRSIAMQIIGPIGVVYPTGRDAGRDFTFDGAPLAYSSRKWDGYCVLQAKCLENCGSADDVDWLIGRLKEEEKAFCDPNSGRIAPKYYIVATNIKLSGADGRSAAGTRQKGGLTKVSDELKRWKRTVGIEDFDIWPHDKISTFLDNLPDIRTSYAAWVTSSDILSEMLAFLKGTAEGTDTIFRRYLKQAVIKNKFISLKNSGDRSDNKVRTSQVFIDLPVSLPRSEEGSQALSSIVNLARQKLTPEQIDTARAGKPIRNKIVLLGGPGQGKSTVTNYLIQLFRANLVRNDNSAYLDTELSALLTEITDRARQQHVSVNLPYRMPIHISLPKYADRISEARKSGGEMPSLLKTIVAEISQLADAELTINLLRKWITIHPTLIVCDGLDEVPPTGERNAILEAIAQLETDLTDSHCDLLLVVTTRQQGYNNDLSGQSWEHWLLTDLTSERAMSYARVLSAVRYPEDSERAEQIVSKLETALQKTSSQRLMTSPLQVTIMHLIVDIGEGVPVGRWALFNNYFEVLLQRELSKGGPSAITLERNRSHILPIHENVGMILQTKSEASGSAGSYLTRDEFRQVLTAYLKSNGFEGKQLESRVEELDVLTIERLVLLSTREEGNVSFDVRSLQEYSAAAAITSGAPDWIETRLSHIAGKAHWRHVFLISASRVFSNSVLHHLRTALCSIPRDLDTDAAALAAKRGARLALEMFMDGIGADSPTYRRRLAMHALEVLELGNRALALEAAELYEEGTEEIIFDHFTKAALGAEPVLKEMAWTAIARLIDKEADGALDFAQTNWPEANIAVSFIKSLLHSVKLTTLSALVEGSCKDIGPVDLGRKLNHRDIEFNTSQLPHSVQSALHFVNITQRRHQLNVLGSESANILFNRIFDGDYLRSFGKLDAEFLSHAWLPFGLLQPFLQAPAPGTLADYIEQLVEGNLLDLAKKNIIFLPWLVQVVISVTDKNKLLAIASSIRAGLLGNVKDWEDLELRWETTGLKRNDLVRPSPLLKPGYVGPTLYSPLIRHFSVSHVNGVIDEALELVRLSAIVPDEYRTQDILRLTAFITYGEASSPSPELDMKLLTILKGFRGTSLPISILRLVDGKSKRFWAELNELIVGVSFNESRFIEEMAPVKFVDAFNSNNSLRNLLRVIAIFVGNEDVPEQFQLSEEAFTLSPGDSEELQRSIYILRLKTGRLSDDELGVVCGFLFEKIGEEQPYLELIRHANPNRYGSVGPSFLKQALVLADDPGAREVLHNQLNKIFDARSSNFHHGREWQETFHLPDAMAEFVH